MFVLQCKADKLFFGPNLQKAESHLEFSTPPDEGIVTTSFKCLVLLVVFFSFLLSFVFLSLLFPPLSLAEQVSVISP